MLGSIHWTLPWSRGHQRCSPVLAETPEGMNIFHNSTVTSQFEGCAAPSSCGLLLLVSSIRENPTSSIRDSFDTSLPGVWYVFSFVLGLRRSIHDACRQSHTDSHGTIPSRSVHAQGFSWLDNAPKKHSQIEALANRPCVNLHQPKQLQPRHCCVTLHIASCTSMKLGESYAIQICTVLLQMWMRMWSPANHLRMNHPGTNQVFNLHFHFFIDSIAVDLWFGWYNCSP